MIRYLINNLWLNIVILITFSSCALPFLEDKIPPTVPKALETSLANIFEYMSGTDDRILKENIENLRLWFQDRKNLEKAREGLLISGLPESAVQNLDTQSSKLQGITVATKTSQCPEGIAGLITWDKFGDVLMKDSPGLSYKRNFTSDADCFWKRECLSLVAESNVDSQWGGLVDMNTQYIIEFKWVQIEENWVFLHRFWLKKNAKNDSWGLNMKANYYLGLTFFDGARDVKQIAKVFQNAGNGAFGVAGDQIKEIQDTLAAAGSLRVHANWFDIDLGKVENALTEEQVINQLIQTQVNDSQKHDVLISKYEVPGECEVVMEEGMGGIMAGEEAGMMAGKEAGVMAGEEAGTSLDLSRDNENSIGGVWLLNVKLSNGISFKLKAQVQYTSLDEEQMMSIAKVDGILQRENDPLEADALTDFSANVNADGSFDINLPQLSLDVGLLIEGDLFLNAQIFIPTDVERSHWCGQASGMINKPLMLDLTGSTFYAWPIDENPTLPEPLPDQCP